MALLKVISTVILLVLALIVLATVVGMAIAAVSEAIDIVGLKIRTALKSYASRTWGDEYIRKAKEHHERRG